ncbi:hypothetical protein D6D29_05244 [Aureobasidium pullulans]|nr:hypothetical protein D6D29_05244 [Aureobasidium pullulans]
MLWTSDPPRLRPDHPIRRAFYRHGLITARYWLLCMLVSVSVGVSLIYPTVFLSDFPAAGLSGLPHHVWASTRAFPGDANKPHDLEMRQIWIHGSYMKALEKDLLRDVFVLQNAILGDAATEAFASDAHRIAHPNWGYHSPLTYWNNSLARLEADPDILQTVNENTCQPSFLNFTLRPLSVFAGKAFSGSQLETADALIISLFNRNNDPKGEIWQRNIQIVASQSSGLPIQYQRNGTPEHSQLFEYRIQPLSFRQNSLLAMAYGIIFIYVGLSLRRLKAFHSRFGLVVTAITQMTTSILASFTICGLLQINLAQIPQEAYPFVVLVIGLENIFRLINAVVAYPPEMMNTQRIANGMADIGHSSLASAAQNLLILWLLSLVVSPGVAAFCAFAAVALLFDYFFLLTFFLAVLSVDIRRLELQDSITRSSSSQPKQKSRPKHHRAHSHHHGHHRAEKHRWVDALIHGKVPFSTRMAGSAVTISFVMALNWHLTAHGPRTSASGVFPGLFEKQALPMTAFDGTVPPPTDQSPHPATWLRTQDYENAVHFMKVVKPGAQGFVAKIYDPLIITLGGADRSGILLRKETWLNSLRGVAIQHFYPTAITVVFVVAFVTVLMNFLLWDDRAEDAEYENGGDNLPLTVHAIETGHMLDVVKITGCRQGHMLSISLDRTISILLFKPVSNSYMTIHPSPASCAQIKWPIHACSISDKGDWMAILDDNGKVLLGNLSRGEFTHDFNMDSEEKLPLLFEFVPSPSTPNGQGVSFAVVSADGKLTEYHTHNKSIQTFRVSEGELLAASFSLAQRHLPKIVLLHPDGHISALQKASGMWSFREMPLGYPRPLSDKAASANACLQTIDEVEASLICTTNTITLLHTPTVRQSGSFNIPNVKPNSVRVLHTGRNQCLSCGGMTASSLSLVFTDNETRECVVRTYAAQGEPSKPLGLFTEDLVCNCAAKFHWEKIEHRLQDAGSWESTTEAVVGLRRKPQTPPSSPVILPKDNGNILRRRRRGTGASTSSGDENEQWEAYLYSASGELHTVAIDMSGENQLYATRAGPACQLGYRSVAIVLGSTVYVIKVWENWKDNGAKGVSDGGSQPLISRRRWTRKAQ